MRVTAEQLIKHLGLKPLPVEGGYFRESYRSVEMVSGSALPSHYSAQKALCTAIYYLLTADLDSFSALHKLPTDEIYHFYLGDPVELLLLKRDGSAERIVLGQDVLGGQRVQYIVPRDVWQGSRVAPGGEFALMGTTMAPGFHQADFVAGDRASLSREFPAQAEFIRCLTRT